MKKLSTYLLIFFVIIFWVFRVVVAVTNTIGIDLGFEILNYNIEVVLLFVTILSIVLLVKRKILGALIYLFTYGAYFGTMLYNNIMNIINQTATIETYATTAANFIGILIPLCVMFDLLLDKNRLAHPVDKKTDWFYKNKEYDRKLDDRSDKNNYRTL